MRRFQPLALTALLLLAGPVKAQQTLWQSCEIAGKKAFDAGKYAQAEKLMAAALQAAENSPPSPNRDAMLAKSYNDLGAVSRDLGKYAQSEELIHKAIPLITKTSGEDSPMMGYALLNLANIYVTMAKPAEAEQLYLKVVDIAEEKSKKLKNNSIMALPLTNLANAYIEDSKYTEASAILDRALAVYDRAKVKKDIYYVGIYGNYCALYRESSEYKKSEVAGKKCVESAEEILGKNHPYYAKSLTNLAKTYSKLGRYKDAEALLTEAKDLTEKNLGFDHPEVSSVLGFLAENYENQGNYQQAEPLVAKALELGRRAYGTDHPLVAENLTTQGNIFHDQGKYKEAEDDYKQAIQITESTLGADHPRVAKTMDKLAELYLDEGKTADAEKLLRHALDIEKKKLSADNPDVADLERLLAVAYKVEGKYSEAETLYRHAIQSTETSLGKEHAQYGSAIRDLGRLYQTQSKFQDAEALYKQCLAIDEKVYGAQSAKVASDLDLLSKLYVLSKEPAKAIEITKRSDDIKKQLPGSAQLSVLKTAITDNAQKLKQPTSSVADKWALVVGISNFQDPSINLKYAAKDATDFKNFLVNKEQFQPDHVKLLTDKNATRENIINQLGDKWLGKLANREDLVVIYLSTHGSGSQQEAGGVNFLVAEDTNKNSLLATGIPMQWLTSIIKEQVHSNRVVLIMDVCHSAAAAPGEKSLFRGNSVGNDGGAKGGVDAQKIPLGEGQSMLCSSLADQVSWESKSYPNSVFTKKLMEALQVKGQQTTLTDAYNYLKDAVESEVLRDRAEVQTPILNTKLWTGGDAIMAVKPAKPRKGL